MKKNVNSLHFIISFSIILVILMGLSTFFIYNYFDTKTKLESSIEESSQLLSQRLNKSIVPFIKSYSIDEYENILHTELNDKLILAIVVEDYVTSELINLLYITGKTRDKDWNIIDFSIDKKLVENDYLSKSTMIYDGDKKIAKIDVYLTHKFLNEELKSLTIKSIVTTLIISILLITILYISLNRYILTPINKIISYIDDKDENGLPKGKIDIDNSAELLSFSNTLSHMVDQVKNSKKEIEKLNERFELTIASVNDGIWDWNINTDKTFYSKRWKEMLGYGDDEIENTAQAAFALIHEDDLDKVKETIEKHFENPEQNKYSIEIRFRCKDGTYKWILSRGKALFDENNKPFRMLGYHSDISLEKEKEEILNQQNKIIEDQSKLASMGEMIGNIAHQWRQPLSVITTAASSIRLKTEYNMLKEEELLDISDMVVNQAQYLSKTIDDFRNFIKDDAKFEEISIKEVLESTFKLTSATISNNHIELVSNIQDDIQITGNINELEQAFINILNNSKDAINENLKNQEYRYIFVSTKKIDENTLELKFLDNGGGIPKEIKDRVFEPYFTTKHQSVGTGLGLAMVNKIITQRHHQSITIENEEFEYKGNSFKGAAFIITFINKD